MRLIIVTALSAIWVAAFAFESHAAILYSTTGSTYTQNFDSLPNTPQNATLGNSPTGWTDDNASPASGNFSIVGWYIYHETAATEGGFNSHQRVRIGAGTVNTGAVMSFGDSGSTERALGSVNSNTLAPAASAGPPPVAAGFLYYGARFTNNTTDTLTKFTLSYNGEQWRDGGAATPVAQSLIFGYMVGAANVQDPGFTTGVPALDFTSPVFANTGSGAAVNGNTAGRVAKGPFTVNGLNWAPNTDLWIRWADVNDSGNDHGLGIDDVSISADIPEPSSLMLLVAAVFGIALAKRRSVG